MLCKFQLLYLYDQLILVTVSQVQFVGQHYADSRQRLSACLVVRLPAAQMLAGMRGAAGAGSRDAAPPAELPQYIPGCPKCCTGKSCLCARSCRAARGWRSQAFSHARWSCPQQKRFCPVLFPSPKQEMEHGFGSCSAPSSAACPRGRCPCLSITSGSPAAPFPCPRPASTASKAPCKGSWLQSSPSPACPCIPLAGLQSRRRVLKEEEIFQQCLCSFRDGLKLQ